MTYRPLGGAAPDVELVEVGPRDGLQNELRPVPLEAKKRLIADLVEAGLRRIEVGAFVSPKWVPQMADSDQLLATLAPRPPRASVLVPNVKGLERALAVDPAIEVALFVAASETFSQRNTNCSIEESLARVEALMAVASEASVTVRGYISCAVFCPYEGFVEPDAVASLAARLRALGVGELSLGDTIGKATPRHTAAVVDAVAGEVPVQDLAWHGHDTYGQALANVLAALEAGVRVIDSSVAGLGGCPYAKGAAGNLATEDLVFMLDGMGIRTGVDLEMVAAAGRRICASLGTATRSRVGDALSGAEKPL
ncbi:MAG: hydroxymethylglutaryl-CoA lyase [Geminicoccaceae bacterium]